MNSDISPSKPLVSFIVNCYNGDKYLQRCLDSILNQTYDNWELVFWDNASTDKSESIFKSYKHPNFKYYRSMHNVNLGQARAWALNMCRGSYIAFLDVDDTWIPEKTTIQVKGLLSENASFSYGGTIMEVENSSKSFISLPRSQSGYVFSRNLNQFEIQMPTAMISRDKLISKKLSFDPIITASEEYCLFMQYLVDEKVYIVNKPIATYLIREDSLTNKKIDKWAYERRYTLDKIVLSHPGIFDKYQKEFKEAYFRADYYEARYFMSISKKNEARKIIKKAALSNIRYFLLYILLFFPKMIWDNIHKIKNHR